MASIKAIDPPGADIVAGEAAREIAASLCSRQRAAIRLGNAAVQHPKAAQLQAWAAWIAQALGARFGVAGEAANSVGGYLAGAVQGALGLNAAAMVREARRAYLLFNCEAEYDTADPAATLAALKGADTVIALGSYRNSALEYADALPITPFTETAGTFVSCEGRVQSFLQQRPMFDPLGLMNSNKGVFGLNLARLWGERRFAAASMEALLTDFVGGRLKAVVAKTFPLAQAGDAHAFLQNRENLGKGGL